MARHLFLLLLIAAAGCGRFSESDERKPAAPHLAASRAAPLPRAIPARACTPEGYEDFFEFFVRNRADRPALALRGAPVAAFDVDLVDYSWVMQSSPDTALDIDEHRSGDHFVVRAQRVQRNDEDEVVRTVGSARTYGFVHRDGCWKFATIE